MATGAGTVLINTLGVIAGALGIFGFMQNQVDRAGKDDLVFSFKIGLDGAHGPGTPPLTEAGGNIPDIRVFDNQGNFLGMATNDRNKCESGEDNCLAKVPGPIKQQPSYALFTANDDALCVAWASVTYPGGDKYGWVGNWAKECDAPWYYSDIDVQTSNGSDKLFCAWMDSNGDQPTTGIQIHWPEFHEGFKGNGNDPKFYCQDNPALRFIKDKDPHGITFWTKKRDLFAINPSTAISELAPPVNRERDVERIKRTLANDNRLIRSGHAGHSAKELCESKNSVGPSFVSQSERAFCHMPDKKLYQFCDDVQSGACWDDKEQTLSSKGAKGQAAGLASVPDVKFDKAIAWGVSK